MVLCIYKRDTKIVITVSAEVLAPNGARPSAGTVLDEELNMLTSKFLR